MAIQRGATLTEREAEIMAGIAGHAREDCGFMIAHERLFNSFPVGFSIIVIADKNGAEMHARAEGRGDPMGWEFMPEVVADESEFVRRFLTRAAEWVRIDGSHLIADLTKLPSPRRFIGYTNGSPSPAPYNHIAWRPLWGRVAELAKPTLFSQISPVMGPALARRLRECAIQGQL